MRTIGTIEGTYAHDMADYILVYLVLILDWILRDLLQVWRQILHEPTMALNLTQLYSLDWIGLEHPLNEVLRIRRNRSRKVIVTFLDLLEQLS